MEVRPGTLRKINILLFVLLTCAATIFCLNLFLTVQEPPKTELPPIQTVHLPRSFAQSQEQYDAIGAPFLSLDKGRSQARLPDLRSSIIYYGKNLRPDSIKESVIFLIGIRGESAPIPVSPDEKVFLSFVNRNGSGRWSFSENNNPTPVWITAELAKNGLQESLAIHLFLQTQDGKIIQEPQDLSRFTISELPLPPATPLASGWKIGSDSVDASYLVKQKAKWYGKDLFLQEYGGEEYAFSRQKERIQFDQEGNEYAVFVSEGDVLAYANNIWEAYPIGEKTIGKPLLLVKKIEERRMLFDLWDEDGKRRFTIELGKTQEAPINSQKLELKLIGARSKTNWIISLAGKRTLVRSDDWILLNTSPNAPNQFEIIKTAEEIDEYIAGNLKGELLVLEGIEREQQGSSYLKGSLFSASHTQILPLKIAMQKPSDLYKSGARGASPQFPQGRKGPLDTDDSEDDDEDEDDEDEDDDEDDDEDQNDDETDDEFAYV